ncbi:PREDICTED: uncharacterized protein LOC106820178, partial [Priapulus caudatus]|uniref:Uncharacterized protein LOC106820178 n=1 Tax=Priapulus caudatus TaxID=37621 RepID=A0ABM1F6Y6_PRICU
VKPGESQTVTSRHLRATTDHPEQDFDIIYVLVNKPEFGEVVARNRDNVTTIVDSFSQRDVDDSLIAYLNTRVPENLPAEDAFSFDISAKHGSTIYNEVMLVLIGETTEGERQELLFAGDLEVLEGAAITNHPGFSQSRRAHSRCGRALFAVGNLLFEIWGLRRTRR